MMFKMKLDIDASLPYFGVELSCVLGRIKPEISNLCNVWMVAG